MSLNIKEKLTVGSGKVATVLNHLKSLHFDMEKNLLPCHKELILNGKIHRYCKEKTKDHDEWYIGHELPSGHVVCTYGSWSKNFKATFRSWEGQAPPDDYDPDLIQQTTEFELKQRHKEAADRAAFIYANGSECVDHPYLERKKVKSYGCKAYEGSLVIPIYDYKGNLISLQRITAEGKKKFLWGSRTQSGFCVIGDLNAHTTAYIAEGYATAATIHETTGKPVIIAFSLTQIISVAIILKELHPSKIFYLAAEHGQVVEKTINEWKESIQTSVFLPKFTSEEIDAGNTDFNDLFILRGAVETAQQLKAQSYPALSIESFLVSDWPPLDFIVEDLFVKGGLNVLYSEGGVGKSRLAYALAFALTGASQFLENKILKHQRVCYVDGEMNCSEINTYLKEVISGYEDLPDFVDNPHYFTLVLGDLLEREGHRPIDLFNIESRKKLDELIEVNDFIILDNYTHLTGAGDGDGFENKAESWIPISDWIKTWTRKGKTFLLLHHPSKNGALRGTSRMMVDPQLIIHLSRVQAEDFSSNLAFIVDIEKGRHIKPSKRGSFVAEWNVSIQGNNEPWLVLPIPEKKKTPTGVKK